LMICAHLKNTFFLSSSIFFFCCCCFLHETDTHTHTHWTFYIYNLFLVLLYYIIRPPTESLVWFVLKLSLFKKKKSHERKRYVLYSQSDNLSKNASNLKLRVNFDFLMYKKGNFYFWGESAAQKLSRNSEGKILKLIKNDRMKKKIILIYCVNIYSFFMKTNKWALLIN
jgi:hypothetical protein